MPFAGARWTIWTPLRSALTYASWLETPLPPFQSCDREDEGELTSTALLTHPFYMDHDSGPGHPECPGRLRAILDRLSAGPELGGRTRARYLTPDEAAVETIEAIHSREHISRIEELSNAGYLVPVAADTVISQATYRAALLACGGVQRAVDEIMAGSAKNAFCAHRPPGHHAEYEQAMGFCYFNHVAVGARYAQQRHGLEKVGIIDWDVHHGNGTQHSFEADPTVFFFSIHQFPHYPGTGARSECGRDSGLGTTLNAPVPAGYGNAEYEQIFSEVLIPAMEEFQPDFLFVSAGFDAHRSDPLGGVELTEDGFETLTKLVMDIAAEHCGGRLVSVLEGGYNLDATAASVERHLEVLSRDETDQL